MAYRPQKINVDLWGPAIEVRRSVSALVVRVDRSRSIDFGRAVVRENDHAQIPQSAGTAVNAVVEHQGPQVGGSPQIDLPPALAVGCVRVRKGIQIAVDAVACREAVR